MAEKKKWGDMNRKEKTAGLIILAIIAIIVIAIIIAVASGGKPTKTAGSNATNQAQSNNSTPSTPAATQPAATQPAATQPAATQPAATQPAATQPAATQPAAKVATRQVTGTATTLGAGTFTGGTDVAAGLYDVTTGAGQSGNFMVNGTDSYNEILDSSGENGEPKIRVQISKGDQIQISDLNSVIFTPVATPFVTTHSTVSLYAGTWTVGQDIGAGRYVATPGSGQSGNFIVTGNDSYDEILDSSGANGDTSLTVNLSNGDIIDISGMSQVTMTASN